MLPENPQDNPMTWTWGTPTTAAYSVARRHNGKVVRVNRAGDFEATYECQDHADNVAHTIKSDRLGDVKMLEDFKIRVRCNC